MLMMLELLAPFAVVIAALLVIAGVLLSGRWLIARLGLIGEPPPELAYAPPPPPRALAPPGARDRAAAWIQRQAICTDALFAAQASAALADYVDCFPDAQLKPKLTQAQQVATEAAQRMHDQHVETAARVCAAARTTCEDLLSAARAQLGPLPAPSRGRLLLLLLGLLLALGLAAWSLSR